MRVKLIWEDRNHPNGFEEITDSPDEIKDLVKWGRNLIERFNDVEKTRYGSKALIRTFVSCQPLNLPNKEHDWKKVNLITCHDPRLGMYDIYQCQKCGIKGKRFGFAGVKRDSRYRAKAYRYCDTAQKFIERKKRA
jgi:hypothetical protein